MTTRLRLGLVSIVALATLAMTAAFSGAASAGIQPAMEFDPQATNVPYLAWRGTQVRLVKCVDDLVVNGGFVGRFMIEDWSGDPFQRPQILDNDEYVNSFPGTGEQTGRDCFATEIVSLKAGCALVKLKIAEDSPGGRVVVEHQFLVCWMQIASANLSNVAGPLSHPLGDTTANQVQVLVTGSIPLGGNFEELGLGAQIVMPNDWARFAQRFARTSIGGHERDPCSWDIHDELSWEGPGPDTHNNRTATWCTVRAAGAARPTPIDNVDNSTWLDGTTTVIADELGPFTRAITTDSFRPTIGPFDHLRPGQTYLPDGVLDAGDAPMPALRVDVHLRGDGLLTPIDKGDVYRTPRGETPNTLQHDLYAPFYQAYIPATSFPGTASGTSQGVANNFHGFQTTGIYNYWNFAVAISRTAQTRSECPPFSPGIPAAGPGGVHEVVVYTDEHGEARVGYLPGTGVGLFLTTPRDANGACDIQGINPIGTGTITADARYPSQPVTIADVGATGAVVKTITSLFNKQITCVPKFPTLGTTGNFAFICTVTARGATGAFFANEIVCFITNAESIFAYNVVTTQVEADDPRNARPERLCLRLNSSGQAQVEVIGKGALNVIADFTDERIFRLAQINALPPSVAGATTSEVTSTQAPTAAQIVSLGGQTVVNQPSTNTPTTKPTAPAKAKLVSARFVTKKGVRTIRVRVNSPAKQAKIKLVMKRNGKTVATAVRTVKTNRLVTVPKLRIAKKVNRINVSVLR